MNYYAHHIGDYAAATAHLSWDEDMAYTRLLRAYYHNERGITDGERYRTARATTTVHRKAVDSVLAEFFELVSGVWIQKRAEDEIARFRDKQGKAKASAQSRWSQPERIALALPTHTERPMRTHSERNAMAMLSNSHNQEILHPPSSDAVCDLPPGDSPPYQPVTSEFTGENANTLNGKAVASLATSFELPDQWGFDAEALGFKPPEVLREAERFRQYWTAGRGKGSRRSVKGWRQTWSNWLEKAAKDHR